MVASQATFLARVLNVGCIGNVGVSRDRIEIREVMRAIGVPPLSARVLNVERIGNLGVCASQNRNIGSYEGKGNDVFLIIVFHYYVGARIARPQLLRQT